MFVVIDGLGRARTRLVEEVGVGEIMSLEVVSLFIICLESVRQEVCSGWLRQVRMLTSSKYAILCSSPLPPPKSPLLGCSCPLQTMNATRWVNGRQVK